MNPIRDEFPKGTLILARKPDRQRGRTTGGFRRCALEGCCGIRIGVRWKDGKLTWPCSRGMEGNRIA